MIQKTLHLPKRERSGDVRLDYLGAVLVTAAVSTLLIWVTLAGSQFGWASLTSYLMVGGSVLAAVLFVLVERRAHSPLLPMWLFRNRTVVLTIIASIAVGVAMFGTTVFLSQYMQLARGETPTTSGLLTLPMVLGSVVSSIVIGQLISRTGVWKRYMVTGTLFLTVGLALMGTIHYDTPFWHLVVFMAVVGIGIGAVMQNLMLVTQNVLPVTEMGAGSSSVTFFRSLGGAVGVSAMGALLGSQASSRIVDGLASLGVPASAMGSGGSGQIPDLSQLPGPVRLVVEQSYGEAVAHVFLAAVPLAVVAFVAVALLPNLPLGTKTGIEQMARSGPSPRAPRSPSRRPSRPPRTTGRPSPAPTGRRRSAPTGADPAEPSRAPARARRVGTRSGDLVPTRRSGVLGGGVREPGGEVAGERGADVAAPLLLPHPADDDLAAGEQALDGAADGDHLEVDGAAVGHHGEGVLAGQHEGGALAGDVHAPQLRRERHLERRHLRRRSVDQPPPWAQAPHVAVDRGRGAPAAHLHQRAVRRLGHPQRGRVEPEGGAVNGVRRVPSTLSAVTAGPLGVVGHGRGDAHGRGHEVVDGVEHLADPVAPAVEQRERERPVDARGVRTGDVAVHRDGDGGQVGPVVDELGALDEAGGAVQRREADEVAPVLALRVGAGQRAPADVVGLLARQRPARPRSAGVTVPSVSCPTMGNAFSARRTCIVSVPYGVMSCGAPAAATASHSAAPHQAGTVSSKASSPENDTRATRPGRPARSASRCAMKAKPSADQSSSGASASTTARERGPATATVAQWSVCEVQTTSRWGHSVRSHSSSVSSTAAALPVVVDISQSVSESRIVVPSSTTIPSRPHITPYRTLPTASVENRFV